MTLIEQANQYFLQGKIQAAEKIYRQLLQQNTNDVNALWGLGKIGLALDSYTQAQQLFSKCITLAPKSPQLWLSLAQVQIKLTQYQQAEQTLVHAYQLKNDFLPTLLALAIFYGEYGEIEKSSLYLTAILNQDPLHIQAFCLQVRLKLITAIDVHAKQWLNQLKGTSEKTSSLTIQDKIQLHYAFATLYHQDQDFATAFKHLEQANQYQYSLSNFTVNDMQPFFSRLLQSFNARKLSIEEEGGLIKSKADHENLTPIFIVGQPRSGSTLLEQMLIGHSEIASGGELPFITGDIAQGLFQLTGKEFPEACFDLNESQRKTLGDHYLKNMQALAPKARFIIDKMPANYQSIGLIKMLMPHAKIVHITREPIDVAWSIFSNNFEAVEPYFCSMEEIVKYYQNYTDVMAMWYQLVPNFIHHISYQQLVEQPEQEITQVLSFCDLAFEKNCLNISGEKRFITTLSDTQLRKGIRKKSSNNWLPYQKYITPLLKINDL